MQHSTKHLALCGVLVALAVIALLSGSGSGLLLIAVLCPLMMLGMMAMMMGGRGGRDGD